MLERGGGVYGDNAIIYSDLAIAIACFAFLPALPSCLPPKARILFFLFFRNSHEQRRNRGAGNDEHSTYVTLRMVLFVPARLPACLPWFTYTRQVGRKGQGQTER